MIPVIAIDGPTASGKGTVAQLVAERLSFHYLDSGALYRLVGLASQQAGIEFNEPHRLWELCLKMDIKFRDGRIFLDQEDVSEEIRTEEMGKRASSAGAVPEVREALIQVQKSFLKPPGLVADGRDMGSVIFPQAQLKVFLTADAQIRAQRRYKQLIAKGISANIDILTKDLEERDLRDTQRETAPLIQSEDAFLLDTSDQTIEEAVNRILAWYQQV
ncbi:cytidylate kinase [Polynucleobacter sp. SHI8]|uniref:(d)CMP kinase n=1 Tax=unclassified Polynucleobacter TaxID=2640945 RepID=UPI0024904599|nr:MULTISPECIES: (d)CMP kinase [unclassified Polynucleobacter]BDW11416.1 cytidylate kinase [Polynucleobacter sp. SHI2]BDW13863.1 cytidylate kinase [Polynucleobacter sp. SHI8]